MSEPWARYADGLSISQEAFARLATVAPNGVLDVFASDQHGSYLTLLNTFLANTDSARAACDDDVRRTAHAFAAALDGTATAALFNRLAYTEPGFRSALGEDTYLIGRLESSATEVVDGGAGKLAKLEVPPEEAVEWVDGFKTLVNVNPDHRESWERNRDWLADIDDRCKRLGKPLFSETLLIQGPDEDRASFASRLPEALVQITEEFGAYGAFYKTQVPLLWVEDGSGGVRSASSAEVVRRTCERIAEICPRPLFLLSAAVDFAQYAAQYALVADLVAAPMCGRAYFKESFSAGEATTWDGLVDAFKRIALPRVRQMRELATARSRPWWHALEWIADEGRALIQTGPRSLASVAADFGY